MLPLLFSANDRDRKRKRHNDACDKFRVHLQESLRENSVLRGYEAQTATQFLQSKIQHLVRRLRDSAASESACQLLERLFVLEFRDVLDRRDSDVQQGFSREESLVAGDDHIWKREQPREHVVAKN